MKTVVKTENVAHLWAHQAQDHARSAGKRLYFEGKTIYSYGSHFPIASHVQHRGKAAIFFTTRDYSVTTSGHKSDVRRAIPRGWRVFYVDRPDMTPAQILKSYREEISQRKAGLASTTHKTKRILAWQELRAVIGKANEFAEYFGYKIRFELPANAAELDALAAEREARLETRRAANEERRRAEWAAWEAAEPERAAAREAARLERERREALTREQRLAELPAIIERWRAGENVYVGDAPETVLRIVGDEIETSRHARFPVEHARRIVPIVSRILAAGETYKRNGHTIHLGPYALDEIDESGTIYAGCHVVSKAETLRLIDELAKISAA